ncbi:hypothetical protein HED49_19745 [Ochrobactrum daejeonense]|nr:hypothetical protein [Brucella daejeonensis]
MGCGWVHSAHHDVHGSHFDYFSMASGLDVASSLLAVSPGGFSEMAATADILKLNVALVTIFHVTRAFIVNGFAHRFGCLSQPTLADIASFRKDGTASAATMNCLWFALSTY